MMDTQDKFSMRLKWAVVGIVIVELILIGFIIHQVFFKYS